MTPDEQLLADLVDGTLSGAEWDRWLAEHPDAAEEVAIARKVRLFMQQLQASDIVVPPGFEARLRERLRSDKTLLDLLDLGFNGIAQALLELLNTLLNVRPAGQSHPV